MVSGTTFPAAHLDPFQTGKQLVRCSCETCDLNDPTASHLKGERSSRTKKKESSCSKVEADDSLSQEKEIKTDFHPRSQRPDTCWIQIRVPEERSKQPVGDGWVTSWTGPPETDQTPNSGSLINLGSPSWTGIRTSNLCCELHPPQLMSHR